MVLAGTLTNPCAPSGELRVFVPNNVEPSTAAVDPDVSSSLSAGDRATLALGASYAHLLPPVIFYDSYPAQIFVDASVAELDGEIVRAIYTTHDDDEALATLACQLAEEYEIVDYGSSLSNSSLCQRIVGKSCRIDSQCMSGSKCLNLFSLRHFFKLNFFFKNNDYSIHLDCFEGVCSTSECLADECSTGDGTVCDPLAMPSNFKTADSMYLGLCSLVVFSRRSYVECVLLCVGCTPQSDLVYVVADNQHVYEFRSDDIQSSLLDLGSAVSSGCESDCPYLVDVARYSTATESYL